MCSCGNRSLAQNTRKFLANIQALYPKNGDICSAKMESEVAGYSSVSLGCLHKCARSYVSKFGKYHLWLNSIIFTNSEKKHFSCFLVLSNIRIQSFWLCEVFFQNPIYQNN
jgi:hypothetical protein